MFRKQINSSLVIIVLGCGIILGSCHSTAKEDTVRGISKDDSAVQSESKKAKKNKPDSIQVITVIDTIIGKDTIAISKNCKGIVKCSINRLSDTYLWQGNGWYPPMNWDFKSDAYSIITPDNSVSKIILLNDSLVFFTQIDGDDDSPELSTELFLLKRMKTSLKFSNPLWAGGISIYINLANNTIITYTMNNVSEEINKKGFNKYPKEEPYLVDRYKIEDSQFVKTESDTLLLKQFSKAENPFSDEAAWALYTFLDHHKNWKQFRYVPGSN